MLFLVPGILASCRNKSQSTRAKRPTEADLAQAEQVLKDFLKAVEAEDCTLAVQLMDKGATREDCEDFVRNWKGHDMKFLGIDRSYVDGRNPNAIVVRALVQKAKKQKTTLFRLVREGDQWKLRH